MPKVRKLSEDEVLTLERKNKGQRKLIEEQYDAFLDGYNLGDYGEAELEPDENRITVRNRLKAAAARRELALDFRRTKGNTLRFRVISLDEATDDDDDDEGDDVEEDVDQPAPSAPVEEPAASEPPKRRGGRRKKTDV
jgi:hypothetical protein